MNTRRDLATAHGAHALVIAVVAVLAGAQASADVGAREASPENTVWPMSYGSERHSNRAAASPELALLWPHLGVEWVYDWGERQWANLVAQDLDGNGFVELVIASDHQAFLAAIEAYGGPRWRHDGPSAFEGRSYSTPLILGSGDATSLIYGTSDPGYLTSVSGSGALQWSHEMQGRVEHGFMPIDVDGDARAEIIYSSYDPSRMNLDLGPASPAKSQLGIISGAGEILAQRSDPDLVMVHAAIPHDIDDNGHVDIFIHGRVVGHVTCTECDEIPVSPVDTWILRFEVQPNESPLGLATTASPYRIEERFRTQVPSHFDPMPPLMVDFDGGGTEYVVSILRERNVDDPEASSGSVIVWNTDGTRIATFATRGQPWEAATLRRAASAETHLVITTNTGLQKLAWNGTNLTEVGYAPLGEMHAVSAADLDADGSDEIIASQIGNYRDVNVTDRLLVLDIDLRVRYEHPIHGEGIASIIPVDADSDGTLEIVALAHNGLLYIFGDASPSIEEDLEAIALEARENSSYEPPHRRERMPYIPARAPAGADDSSGNEHRPTSAVPLGAALGVLGVLAAAGSRPASGKTHRK